MNRFEPDRIRFERIHIEGFRRLGNVELELRPLCVLIGANGSGKTSLLDVLSLLTASASGGLRAKLSDMGGLDANIGLNHARWLACKLSLSAPDRPSLHYRLALAPQGSRYEILDEMLYEERAPHPPPFKHLEASRGNVGYFMPDQGQLLPPTWDYDPLESALSQVPKQLRELEDFRKRLASSAHYHVLNVEARSPVRLPQPLSPAVLPGADGEDLVSCLFHLREADRDRYEQVEDALRAGFRDFERLDFPPVAAGTLAMTWKDRRFPRPLFMHQLSEGTLRFLWLVALLLSPDLPAVTLIDEPEVSLHPELLSLLADLARDASLRTQLIMASHSDRLVRFLHPDEVVAMDIEEDGTASATWADQLDIDQWLKDFALDEVWSMGRIGARQ